MEKQERGGMTRRDFAKMSAIASFAVLTAGAGKPEAAAEGKAKLGSDAIKIGIIGCGGRGSGAVLDCLNGNENVKLIAMADAFEDRLQGALDKFTNKSPERIKSMIDVKPDHCFVGLDAYEKLLKTDVDMIIHATPPYARPKHIAAAVKAGKHIFTEKPIAVDPAGVRMFIDAAKEAEQKKLCFVTGLQRRHQAKYIKTIEKIAAGEIGDVLAARAYWNGSLPFCFDRKPEWKTELEYRLRNWYNQVWTCGDNIVEQHVHNLDVINWVMSAVSGGKITHPKKVVSNGGRAWKPREEKYGDLWDNFACDFEYENGVHLLSFCRHWNKSAEGVFEEVTGTKGKSTCEDKGRDEKNPYQQEHIDLIACIRGEAPYRNDGFYTADSTMTGIMGRMAAFTGKEYTWDEALNEKLSIVPDDLSWDKAYPIGPIAVPGA
jgi:predicted dehydrogenase